MSNAESGPRQRILATADQLFYAHGLRAVGTDRIIAEADVAKASLYKHFPSKDALITAFIEQRAEAARETLEQAVLRLSPDPVGRPLAIFDALHEKLSRPGYRGCAFINSIVELADPEHAAHRAADRHKRDVMAYYAQVLASAGYAAPSVLAGQFALLVDGAMVTALRENAPDAALRARAVAELLLAGAARA